MTGTTLGDRLALARLGIGRGHSHLRARSAHLPVLGRRLLRPLAEDFVFVPPDLRPVDPSLIDEMLAGQMGLAGRLVDIGANSPFAVRGADPAWSRGLHGFAWLGSLRASGNVRALEIARRLLVDWCRRNHGKTGATGIAARPDVTARRVTSWIVNAGFVLDGADHRFHDAFANALGRELRALDAKVDLAAPGYPRLVCRLALALACLSITGQDRDLRRIEDALVAELRLQILADGSHVSRNCDTSVEILLDLLPVRQCYKARNLAVPGAIELAVPAMMTALRATCTTTRALSRFNGVGPSRPDSLATVLALDHLGPTPGTGLDTSGYARLVRGDAILVADCGPPPPLAYATTAHAGCLSFELAFANRMVIVNRGAPGPGHRSVLTNARATASHSTLSLADQSSGHEVRSRSLARLAGAPGMRGPAHVEASVTDDADGEASLTASHDGYIARFGLVHERRLVLSADGTQLVGHDRLRAPRGTLRLSRDLPVAVYFHVPLDALATGDGRGVVIDLPGGMVWRLSSAGCHTSIEAATDYAQDRGPTPARTIVLRTSCAGDVEITWRLEQI